MRVTSKKENNVLIVAIQEQRLDSALAIEFHTLIRNWLGEGYTSIVLDLSEVDFIDSTFLGVIIQWLKEVRIEKSPSNREKKRGDLALCGLGFKVTSLLKLTRMDRVFTIYSDLAQALQTVMTNRA
jgi:anti-sigma B factor antagonist